MPVRPFNPLDKNNIGESIVQQLVARECRPLPALTRTKESENDLFEGAGIYVIYYSGPFELYREQASVNRNQDPSQPIYIGKADPRGGRKGDIEMNAGIGTALYDRLRDHSKSISDADNLELGEFCCKYLVVDEVWIGLAERLAIRRFLPFWNTLIDGFGNHDPGGRRKDQYRSDWDVLHPGRRWAEKLGTGPVTVETISKRVLGPHRSEELRQLAAETLAEHEGTT